MIAELNIKHFRDLLCTEQDLCKREIIVRLLREEEQKLVVSAKKEGGCV